LLTVVIVVGLILLALSVFQGIDTNADAQEARASQKKARWIVVNKSLENSETKLLQPRKRGTGRAPLMKNSTESMRV
jgi:hypothetical protein